MEASRTVTLPPPAEKAAPMPTAPALTDETPVLFDGTVVLFGDLMVQDRKTVAWNPEGECFEGGYGY